MIRMINLRRPLQAGFIAALVFGMVPAVQAATTTQEVRVYVGDLRIESPIGNREMQRRVEAAIDRVCSPASSAPMPNPRLRRLIRECRASAWAGVQAQLASHGLPVPISARQAVSAQR
jgi:UrcA family protein